MASQLAQSTDAQGSLQSRLRKEVKHLHRLAIWNLFWNESTTWIAVLTSVLASSNIVTKLFSEVGVSVLAATPIAMLLVRNTFKFGLRSKWHYKKMFMMDGLLSELAYEGATTKDISERQRQINLDVEEEFPTLALW